MENESTAPTLKNLIAALVGFQSELKNPIKDTANPFFKSRYADLAGIWEACRPGMAKHGLALVQSPSVEGHQVTVTGTLYHISGESIVSVLKAETKDALPQSIGSAVTYLRRYQMSAILGVAAEDDDGAAASGTGEKPKTLAQQKGPFSHGIPLAQHQAEERSKNAAKEPAKEPAEGQAAPLTGQQDLGTFGTVILGGKVGAKGPVNPANGLPTHTLYLINTEAHGELATFSSSVYEAAGRAKISGEKVYVTCEPGKKGPVITAIQMADGSSTEDAH